MKTDINFGTTAKEFTSDHFPHYYSQEFMNSPDTLWLKVTPKTFRPNISIQTGFNAGSSQGLVSLYFLLGANVSVGLNHDWKDLDTLSGAIRSVTSTLKTQGSDLSQTFQTISGSDIGKRFNIYGTGVGAKNDAPIIYENTDRRIFQATLDFAAQFDAEREVWNPIQSLMIWSCAESSNRGMFDTEFKFPYVFRVQTITGDGKETGLVNFTDAAIEQITPVYEAPYKDGYPMKATCQISFKDVNPVYRNQISGDGKSRIKVNVVKLDGSGNARGL